MNSIWSPHYVLLRAKLREMREQAGVTQVELAACLSKPQSYVSKVESGERRLDFLEVRDYCVACEQDFVEFVTTLELLFSPPRLK
jgi:transcriptional regulator with XRE-family HTH domain